MKHLIIKSLFLAAALGSAHCEPSAEDDPFRATCQRLCSSFGCYDNVVDVNECADDHVDQLHSALMISDICGKRYQTMIECAEALGGCSSTGEWQGLRGTKWDYPCHEETVAYLEACPDLGFLDEF